jgi:hypothetical protein
MHKKNENKSDVEYTTKKNKREIVFVRLFLSRKRMNIKIKGMKKGRVSYYQKEKRFAESHHFLLLNLEMRRE